MRRVLVSLANARPTIAFLGLTIGFSWFIWFVGYVVSPSDGALFVAIAVGSFGPAIAAASLTWASGRSVRSWLVDVLDWRLPARWYLAAIGVPVLIYGVATAVLVAAGATLQFGKLGVGVLLFVSALPVATVLTGGNEELGWRGFLLPRLQRRHDALTASVLVGIAWAFWHLPVYLLPTGLIEGTFELFVPFLVLMSVVFTWLYNSTDGSVLLSMLMHGSMNSAIGVFVGILALDSVSTLTLWGSRIVGAGVLVLVLLALYHRRTLSTRPKSVAGSSPVHDVSERS